MSDDDEYEDDAGEKKEKKKEEEEEEEKKDIKKGGTKREKKGEDKYEIYRDYFYTYFPRYSLWPVEVHAICYVLHEHSRITAKSLQQLIEEYVDSDSNAALTIFSPEFLEKYKKQCFQTLEHLIDKPRKYVIRECLKFWNTWDNYALSISYFQIIKFISSMGFTSNTFLISFSKILVGNVHPDPSRRSNYTTTRYKYKSIFYQETSIREYELLIDNFDFESFKSESVKESRHSENLFSQLSSRSSSRKSRSK